MEFSLVTGITPDYMKKLQWCLPTWVMKPQFENRKLYVFHHGFKDAEKDLRWIRNYYPDLELIHWDMEEYENQRELMLSVFVLGSSKHVKEDYFCKLDADTFFTDKRDVFKPDDFELDLFSHSWGYTKPAWWIEKMDAWIEDKEWNGDKSNKGSKGHRRIQSICCLHRTEFVKYAADLAGGKRLPIASHDTYLWYLAEHLPDFKWGSRKLHRHGVGHNSRWKRIRESICASECAWNNQLNHDLLNNVQIHITDACNIGCNNCDRCCGLARSPEHMSVEQIEHYFAYDFLNKTKRIDIIGGEPLVHPKFKEIIQVFEKHRQSMPRTKIRLTTNGTVNTELLKDLPKWISVRNSAKDTSCQEYKFEAFNIAPIDKGFHSHNVQSCSIPWRCGIALTKYGFFLCGAGYGVARVFGLDIGIQKYTDLTISNLKAQKHVLCQYCGHSRSIVKKKEGQQTSKTWDNAFKDYKNSRPILTRYGV